MILRLEHVEHVRPERLRGLHDVGAGRIVLAGDRERRGRAVHGHPGLEQRVDELGRRRKIRLVRRQNEAARVPRRRIAQELLEVFGRAAATPAASATGIRLVAASGRAAAAATAADGRLRGDDPARRGRPAVAVAAFDRVLPHLVDVVEEVLPVARRDVEHRVVRGHRVVDRLPEVPHLRLDRKMQVRVGQLLRRDERNAHRRRVADRLGEQADHVVEVGHRPQAAVPPGRIARALPARDAGLPFRREAAVHRGSHEVQLGGDERVEVVVERIAKGRREHHRAGGAGLVMVVHDLREPLEVHRAVHVRALGLRRHVEVAVVVVTDVLLIEPRQAGSGSARRLRLAHVPARHQLHAVGVRMHGQDDQIVQEARRLGVGAGDELIHGLDQLMRAEDFSRVQPAVDPDHALAFLARARAPARRSAPRRSPACGRSPCSDRASCGSRGR